MIVHEYAEQILSIDGLAWDNYDRRMRLTTKSRVPLLVALAVLLLLVGCGSGSDNMPATPPKAKDTSKSLDALLQVSGSGGWLSSAPIPGGGAAVFQPGKKGVGAVFTLHPAGVVVNNDGVVTKEFELPKTLLSSDEAAVVIDRTLYFAGMACGGLVEDSESKGQTCGGVAPGPLLGFKIDLDSGVTSPLDLPEGLDNGEAAQTRQLGLFRVADRPLLVSGAMGSADWGAWALGKDGTWKSVEAPSSLPCQVGGRAVEASMAVQGGPNETEPQQGDPLVGLAEYRVAARVFDPASEHWGSSIPGPTVQASPMSPTATLCTSERLSIAAAGAPPIVVSNFDPVSETWATGHIMSKSKSVTTHAVDGFADVLLADIEHASPTGMYAYDPVRDVTLPFSKDLESVSTVIALSPTSLLVMTRDGSNTIVRVP